MKRFVGRRCVLALIVIVLINVFAQSQTKPPTKRVSAATTYSQLTQGDTVVVPSETAGSFVSPLVCDEDGNLFLQTEQAGMSAIRKISPRGEAIASFSTASVSDTKQIDVSGPFSVSPDGEVYQIIFPHEPYAFIAIFDSHGRFKSKVKLDTGFGWTPSMVASVGSGYMVVAGMRYDGNPHVHPMRPFTGIFDSSGTLVKEVDLEDDTKIYDMAVAGDQRVSPPENPGFNRAVQHGHAISGEDGNVYLIRILSPAIIYGISAGGAVVHRFTVDPGDPSYLPLEMHMSRDRIAVQFANPETGDQRIIVVDTSGEVIASYEEPRVAGKTRFGLGFGCYLQNPDRFVFLGTKDSNLGLTTAKTQ